MRSLHNLPIVAIALGGVLLLAAAVRLWTSDPRGYWTESDAEARAESGNEFHALAHEWGHASTEDDKRRLHQKLIEAQTRYQQSDAALQEARDRYHRPIRLMQWSGVACLVLGIVGYYALRGHGG